MLPMIDRVIYSILSTTLSASYGVGEFMKTLSGFISLCNDDDDDDEDLTVYIKLRSLVTQMLLMLSVETLLRMFS